MTLCSERSWFCSFDVGQELDLVSQVFFQPRHDLEEVNVKVSSFRRRAAAAAAAAVGWRDCGAHVDGAPAHHPHLWIEAEDPNTQLHKPWGNLFLMEGSSTPESNAFFSAETGILQSLLPTQIQINPRLFGVTDLVQAQ